MRHCKSRNVAIRKRNDRDKKGIRIDDYIDSSYAIDQELYPKKIFVKINTFSSSLLPFGV